MLKKLEFRDTDANRDLVIALVFVLAIALYKQVERIEYLENKVRATFPEFLTVFHIVLIVLLVVVSFLAIRAIKKKINARGVRKEKISDYKYRINRILKECLDEEGDLDEFIKDLSSLLKRIPDFPELAFEKNMGSKELLKAEEKKILSEHHDEIRLLDLKKTILWEEIEKRKRAVENNGEWTRKDLLKDLETKRHMVYKKEKLTKRQCKILIGEGYTLVNEYDVLERKRIPVLVKPIGNHSVAHAFLVWSTRKLIESFDISVGEHLTVDADLTFYFNGEEYAIEVECGSLIGKKEQLKEKIKDLNKKCPKRWMFLVSHRDLYSKYQKFGPASTRADLGKKLRKMLKIPHPN